MLFYAMVPQDPNFICFGTAFVKWFIRMQKKDLYVNGLIRSNSLNPSFVKCEYYTPPQQKLDIISTYSMTRLNKQSYFNKINKTTILLGIVVVNNDQSVPTHPNTSSHVMRTGNPGNLRYCCVIKSTVIGTHYKNLFIRSSEKLFSLRLRNNCIPRYQCTKTVVK